MLDDELEAWRNRPLGEIRYLILDARYEKMMEAFGGVGLDVVSSVIVSEAMGRYASFATTTGAHMGLCVIPILWFGTPEQRAAYLPQLTAGTMVGAYGLSEAASGSDALGARATATRLPDGGYELNGEKLWITNCGFADLFVVFAKVDGEHFTAFLVPRTTPGVTPGREEHKMGLHGSSTAPLLLQGARVGADAVLGEVGKGHKVAFTVLNYGRFKLGAMTTGGAKFMLKDAARYAAERRQFGQPIANFGAIRMKLSEMAARTYAAESALYRLAGSLDDTELPHESRARVFRQHRRQLLDLAAHEAAEVTCQRHRRRQPLRRHLVVFTGHGIDAPNAPPRFPVSAEDKVRALIAERLKTLQSGADAEESLTVLASAAPGADILVHELCDELQLASRLCLPLPAEVVAQRVFSQADRWRARFLAIVQARQAGLLQLSVEDDLPRWLQGRTGIDPWERGNRLVMQLAQAWGAQRVTLLALWDGQDDGRNGGTAQMVRMAKALGLFELVVIDSRQLLG